MKVIIFLIFLLSCLPFNANAQIIDYHYTLFDSYALSPSPVDSRYNVITFLPRGKLLHIFQPREQTVIQGDVFVRAFTFSGIDCLVLKKAVSRNSFRENFGDTRDKILINNSVLLYSNLLCSNNSNRIALHRGEVFRFEKIDSNTIMCSSYRKGYSISGYLHYTDFSTYINDGTFSIAPYLFPEIVVKKSTLPALNTICGEIKGFGWAPRKIAIGDEDTADKIIKTFSLGVINNNMLHITKQIGSDKKSVEFSVYDILNIKYKSRHYFVSKMIYSCEDSTATPSIIERATFIDPVNNINIQIHFTDYETPDDLVRYTGCPYLISINSAEHYFEIVNKFSNMFQSTALGEYFLSQLNRSCSSAQRKKVSKSYSYSNE
jgi:hypothetical protein